MSDDWMYGAARAIAEGALRGLEFSAYH